VDLVARIMPFDLVMDERTADGQEARVSRHSMAASWGAVAGTLRYFADRFGVPRAAIEGTTIPYDVVRRYARRGPPEIAVTGPRRHQGLVLRRRLHYFGFELETIVEPLEGEVEPELLPLLRDALTDALLAGGTVHPDQARLRRARELLGELWRRSGGTLQTAAPEVLRQRIREQLAHVTSWRSFLATRIHLDPDELVPASERDRLLALPSGVRVFGDVAPIDYEVTPEGPVARLRLREGQARRLREADLPRLDRPLRFAVVRGSRPAVRAESLEELARVVRSLPFRERRGKARLRRQD
jgi:hypothetical protein